MPPSRSLVASWCCWKRIPRLLHWTPTADGFFSIEDSGTGLPRLPSGCSRRRPVSSIAASTAASQPLQPPHQQGCRDARSLIHCRDFVMEPRRRCGGYAAALTNGALRPILAALLRLMTPSHQRKCQRTAPPGPVCLIWEQRHPALAAKPPPRPRLRSPTPTYRSTRPFPLADLAATKLARGPL